MHHGTSVVQMDDLIFMLSVYSFYFFHLLFSVKICVSETSLPSKNVPANNISQ